MLKATINKTRDERVNVRNVGVDGDNTGHIFTVLMIGANPMAIYLSDT
jgi:hypothetical protein